MFLSNFKESHRTVSHSSLQVKVYIEISKPGMFFPVPSHLQEYNHGLCYIYQLSSLLQLTDTAAV